MTYEQKLKEQHTRAAPDVPFVRWLELLADTAERPQQLIKIYSIIKKHAKQ